MIFVSLFSKVGFQAESSYSTCKTKKMDYPSKLYIATGSSNGVRKHRAPKVEELSEFLQPL